MIVLLFRLVAVFGCCCLSLYLLTATRRNHGHNTHPKSECT